MTYRCENCGSEWHWIWIKHLKKCLDCGKEIEFNEKAEQQTPSNSKE